MTYRHGWDTHRLPLQPLSAPSGNHRRSGRFGPSEPPEGTQGLHAAWSSPHDTWQIRERFSVSHLVRALLSDGGAKGTRTPDLLVANETRYQLRHSPADRWADQHRDFTTVRPRQTCAFRRLRHRSRCLWKPPERPLSPGLQDSARWPWPDRKGQWYGRSGERAAWKHKSAW